MLLRGVGWADITTDSAGALSPNVSSERSERFVVRRFIACLHL
jgi:hypothetical protein